MKQYIESVHCNGEVKERIWNILDYASIKDIVLYAKRRNMEGLNRAWRIEGENREILESHCDPAFWQYLNR